MTKLKTAFDKIILLVGLLCLALAPPASAMKVHNKDYTVWQNEVIDDDLFFGRGSLTIHGLVKGDVIGFGDRLTIDGRVGGDILFIADQVELTGAFDGDVRVISKDLLCGARIRKNISFISGDSHFTEGCIVGRNLVFMGNSLNFDGTIFGSIDGIVKNIRLNGIIERDVDLGQVDTLVVDNASHIKGRLTYRSPNPGIFHTDMPAEQGIAWTRIKEFKVINPIFARIFKEIWLLVSFIVTSITGAVLIAILPGPMRRSSVIEPGEIPARLLTGLACIVLVPLAILALAVTIIGLPVAFFALGVYILLFTVSWIIASLALGRLLLAKTQISNPHDIFIFILGSFICSLAVSLPIIGILIKLAIISFGTGLVVSRVKRRI